MNPWLEKMGAGSALMDWSEWPAEGPRLEAGDRSCAAVFSLSCVAGCAVVSVE